MCAHERENFMQLKQNLEFKSVNPNQKLIGQGWWVITQCVGSGSSWASGLKSKDGLNWNSTHLLVSLEMSAHATWERKALTQTLNYWVGLVGWIRNCQLLVHGQPYGD